MNKKHGKAASFLAALLMTAALPLSSQTGAWLTAPLTVSADEESYTEGETGDLYYQKYSDHIVISGCNTSASSIVIPDTIEGLPVTKIDTNVGGFSEMKTLTLPDTLTEIGAYAFNWCSNLESVTFPDSLQMIDFQAFEHCTALKTVNFPDHLVKTGSYTLDETPWLDAQRQKDPLVVVNGCLVDARTAKGEVKVPAGVKYVAGGAFSKNNDVTSVVFPSSVTAMGDNVFWYCENLTSAELGGVTYLDWGSFGACNKLKTLKLSGKLTEINSGAFTDNEGTSTITFCGTEDTWNKVVKDPDDAYLKRATIIFDPNGGDPEPVAGDINQDGSCDLTDVKLLRDWLTAVPNTVLADWKAGDMNNDGKLTASDLTLLKRSLL